MIVLAVSLYQLAEPVSVALEQRQLECARLLIDKYGGAEKMIADTCEAGDQRLLDLLQDLPIHVSASDNSVCILMVRLLGNKHKIVQNKIANKNSHIVPPCRLYTCNEAFILYCYLCKLQSSLALFKNLQQNNLVNEVKLKEKK